MANTILMSVFVLGFVGWVMNIFTLMHDTTASMGMIVARAVGILVAPLGAILGYI